MGTVVRPTKAHGTTTYVDEVAAASGHDTIKAVEVDGDLDTLYTLVDGNIDDINIASGANIATSKIAQDAGLQTGHYADGSVTSAKIADGTIVADDIAPDAITTAKILDDNVTLAKMAAGSSVRFGENQSDTSVVVAAEATVLTHSTFTPHGATSLISLDVSVCGMISFSAVNNVVEVIVRLKRNGTLIDSGSVTATIPTSGLVGTVMPFSISLSFLDGLLTTATTYTVTTEKVASAAAVVTASDLSSRVVEHA